MFDFIGRYVVYFPPVKITHNVFTVILNFINLGRKQQASYLGIGNHSIWIGTGKALITLIA